MKITYDNELIIVYNNEHYYIVIPIKNYFVISKESKIIFS